MCDRCYRFNSFLFRPFLRVVKKTKHKTTRRTPYKHFLVRNYKSERNDQLHLTTLWLFARLFFHHFSSMTTANHLFVSFFLFFFLTIYFCFFSILCLQTVTAAAAAFHLTI